LNTLFMANYESIKFHIEGSKKARGFAWKAYRRKRK